MPAQLVLVRPSVHDRQLFGEHEAEPTGRARPHQHDVEIAHPPVDGSVHGHQPVARCFERQPFPGRIPSRQLFLKEEIVEVAVEQGPVHVDEDVVDAIPIQDMMTRG